METWKVAIALSMSSNHNAVLSALSSSLLGVHAQVNKLQGGFSRLKLAIGGALSVTAGMALFGVMEKIVDKTKDYSDELVKLKRLGGDMLPAVNSGAISRQAFDIAQRVPMNVADLLKIPGSLYSIVGQEEAMKMWEPTARLGWVLQSQKDYQGNTGDDIQKIIRAGELSGRLTDAQGKIDPEKMQRYFDLVTKVIAATHGMVNPQSLLGMSQQGGFALRGLTDEGFMTQIIAAQAMGGPRAGTALLSTWQQLAGGTMMSRTAQGMQDLGLLKSGEWSSDHGHVIVNDAASRRVTRILGKDPLDLIANIDAKLKEQGITDPEERARKVMRAFGRQTTQRLTTEELNNYQQILAERERLRGGLGTNASMGLLNNESVTANMVALQNAWTNLLTAVAGPNSQNVISVLQTLTTNINAMTKAVNEMNPDVLKNLGISLGVLAGALTGGGLIAIAAALGPAGWLAAGLIALGAASLAWGDKIQNAMNVVRDFFLNLQSRVLGSINAMGDAIYNALKGIWDKITALFSNSGTGDKFKKDLDESNKNYVPMRFMPGGNQAKPQPISLSLNVDGRRLARAVSDQMDAFYRYPTGGPGSTGGGRFET